MQSHHSPSTGSLVILLGFLVASPAWAQDPLKSVRELYAAAAYEDALSAVGNLDPAAAKLVEADQYRVFCLAALGRVNEAEKAAEAVLMARPEYKPDPAEASPRIQSLFADVRRRIGPGLVKRLYQQARASMNEKDGEAAIAQFEAMLRLADDSELRRDATVAELRELGSGFLELSRAIPAKSRPVAAAPEPAAPVARRSNVVEPPAVIQQRLPAWVPPLSSRSADLIGSLRLQISAEGKVLVAEMIKPIHPVYDQMLIRAARGWLYEPARQGGVAIPFEKMVEIKVTAPNPAGPAGSTAQKKSNE